VKKLVLINLILCVVLVLKAQDPHFSQTYTNLLYLSPSFTGATNEYRVTANYRNQWPHISSLMATTAASFDYNMSKFNSGIGLLVTHDVIGTSRYSNSMVGVSYSYNIKINRKLYFRPGLMVKYGQTNIDLSKLYYSSNLEFGPGFDVPVITDGDKVHSFDGAVSSLLLHQQFWLGVTLDHIFTPNLSFSSKVDKLPLKTTVFGGYKFQKAQRLISATKQQFSIAGNYRHQGVSDQFDLGLYTSYDLFIAGVWYRNLPFIKEYKRQDAIVFVVGVQYEGIQVGYSYDFSISKLITSTGGAHELSLVYVFDVNPRKKYRTIPCPKI